MICIDHYHPTNADGFCTRCIKNDTEKIMHAADEIKALKEQGGSTDEVNDLIDSYQAAFDTCSVPDLFWDSVSDCYTKTKKQNITMSESSTLNIEATDFETAYILCSAFAAVSKQDLIIIFFADNKNDRYFHIKKTNIDLSIDHIFVFESAGVLKRRYVCSHDIGNPKDEFGGNKTIKEFTEYKEATEYIINFLKK